MRVEDPLISFSVRSSESLERKSASALSLPRRYARRKLYMPRGIPSMLDVWFRFTDFADVLEALMVGVDIEEYAEEVSWQATNTLNYAVSL